MDCCYFLNLTYIIFHNKHIYFNITHIFCNNISNNLAQSLKYSHSGIPLLFLEFSLENSLEFRNLNFFRTFLEWSARRNSTNPGHPFFPQYCYLETPCYSIKYLPPKTTIYITFKMTTTCFF